MSVYTPSVHLEGHELAKWLRHGKPEVGWRGDPSLELRVGVLSAKKSGWNAKVGRVVRQGEPLAQRWEVWRHCEDGVERRLAHWRLDEFFKILPDLVQMDPRKPGHQGVLDRIDRANAQVEKKQADLYVDRASEMMDHYTRLWHDRTQPKNIFRFAEPSPKKKGYKVNDKRRFADAAAK